MKTVFHLIFIGVFALFSSPVMASPSGNKPAIPPEKVESTLKTLDSDLHNLPLYAAIKEVDPQTYRKIEADMRAGISEGKSLEQIRNGVMPYMSGLVAPRIPYASDEALIESAEVSIEMLETMSKIDPYACYDHLSGNSAALAPIAHRIPKDLKYKEQAVAAKIIRSYSAKRIIPTAQEVQTYIDQVNANMQKIYSDEQLQLLSQAQPTQEQKPVLCNMIIDMYRLTLALPKDKAVKVLRNARSGS